MTDLDKIIEILDRANQPHFQYNSAGTNGVLTYLVLDDRSDGGREVALLIFDSITKQFVGAGTRWFDP